MDSWEIVSNSRVSSNDTVGVPTIEVLSKLRHQYLSAQFLHATYWSVSLETKTFCGTPIIIELGHGSFVRVFFPRFVSLLFGLYN
jgi:hypothetical protein